MGGKAEGEDATAALLAHEVHSSAVRMGDLLREVQAQPRARRLRPAAEAAE